MKTNVLKSLQRKLINILTSVQDRTLGLEAGKELITNLFGKYDECEKIMLLEQDLQSVRNFIRSKHLSAEYDGWLMREIMVEKLPVDWEDQMNDDQLDTGQE